MFPFLCARHARSSLLSTAQCALGQQHLCGQNQAQLFEQGKAFRSLWSFYEGSADGKGGVPPEELLNDPLYSSLKAKAIEERAKLLEQDRTRLAYRLYCRGKGTSSQIVQGKAHRADGSMILSRVPESAFYLQWIIHDPVDTASIKLRGREEEPRPLTQDEWEAIVAPWQREDWCLVIGSSDKEDWRFAGENSRMLGAHATVRDVLTAVHDMVCEVPSFCRNLIVQKEIRGKVHRGAFPSFVFFDGFVWRGLKGREATVCLSQLRDTPHGLYHPWMDTPKTE